jgi:chitodextrinase
MRIAPARRLALACVLILVSAVPLALAAASPAAPSESRDRKPPTPPTGVAVTAATQTSVSIGWDASRDNRTVTAYGIFRDGTTVGSTADTSWTFTELACDTTYTLAVDAADAAGNRSTATELVATTAACAPAADTRAPTTPTALTVTGATPSSITASWPASSDDVGVAGYGLYRDGTLVDTSGTTQYTFAGLACDTAYALAVDAVDAARNRSAKATVNASTAPCPSGGTAAVYLSPAGSDSGACTQAAPCRSLARGYAVAQLGQTVELAGGAYGGQTLTGSKAGSGVVTFRPASGADVQLGALSLNGQTNIEFRGLAIDNWYAKYVRNVTFRDVTTRFFFVRSSDTVAILGGSVGGVQDGTSPTIGNYAGDPVSTNVTVDGVLFHDVGRQDAPGAHVECLFLQEAADVVIRNSKFTRCDIMDLYVSPIQGGPTAYDVTVENNWFDQPTGGGYYALDIHPDYGSVPRNFVVRYNSFNGSILLYDGFTYDNVSFVGNVGRIAACGQAGVEFAFNVWSNLRCGPTDRVAPAGYVDAAGFDLHLAAGSAAIGAGDPSRYPASDIDGDPRPVGGAPDAGSDER